MLGFAVAHYDKAAFESDPTLRNRFSNWVSGFGLDPGKLLPYALITGGEGAYVLHVSEIVHDESGEPVVDEALCALVSRPVTVEIGNSGWPYPGQYVGSGMVGAGLHNWLTPKSGKDFQWV